MSVVVSGRMPSQILQIVMLNADFSVNLHFKIFVQYGQIPSNDERALTRRVKHRKRKSLQSRKTAIWRRIISWLTAQLVFGGYCSMLCNIRRKSSSCFGGGFSLQSHDPLPCAMDRSCEVGCTAIIWDCLDDKVHWEPLSRPENFACWILYLANEILVTTSE